MEIHMNLLTDQKHMLYLHNKPAAKLYWLSVFMDLVHQQETVFFPLLEKLTNYVFVFYILSSPFHMEAKPHARTLEINVISGESICVDRSSVAENVYVVVRAESLNCCTTKMVNKEEGVFAWDEKFLLDVPSYATSVTFEVQSKRFKGVRPIGVARIALSDLIGDNNNNNKVWESESNVEMFSYGLRDWEGQRNGVIHFSVKVVTPKDQYSREDMKAEKETISRVSSGRFGTRFTGFQNVRLI
ncbi:hypothetical protein VNO77_07008 [Canavalia gladiata]|uniref:C2 domain-containing protein n=1 Tax=Canavalia gladiata TaxID=3824 RepID=A0AAN9M831_CANGL